ncbi:peptidase M14 carboxypeptidase [Nocardia brasiliensis ATCC 700358]|uniref:Peptidase M14 carboxypeptidase n=1 Tax=Nocardia brasiliensis (strain ATCC 700358 / HUJEG-1) TaxID=1133849 RepID=K0F3V2_NOCB7|nr:peptidase M14 carboxypeptidase [Nocardia brasiliensis ATCC 700358]
MSRFRNILASITVAAVGGFSTLFFCPVTANAADDSPYYWDVPVPSRAQVEIIENAGIEMVPAGPGKVTIAVDEAGAQALRAKGLTLTKKAPVYKSDPSERRTPDATYYGGYHTAADLLRHATDTAAKYPGIAQVHNIGKSWLADRGRGGHTMNVICLTGTSAGTDAEKAAAKTTMKPVGCDLAPTTRKPRFLLTAQIHARELATGELAWKWIDYLATGYGTDPAVTSILDNTEVWVVPVTNPDGVDVTASGGNRPKMQRKNVNNSATPPSCSVVDGSGQGPGVDLNRNFTVRWGGDSRNPCAQTYQGPRAGSEPETQAIQKLYASLFTNQRPSGGGDVPQTATGIVIDLHAYGNYGIIPSNATSRNATQLRALTKKIVPSGFVVGTSEETVGYSTTGTTDDQAHGALGLAAITIEIGPNSSGSCGGFMPRYSCVESTFWPQMKKAFSTAAQLANAPYKQGGQTS